MELRAVQRIADLVGQAGGQRTERGQLLVLAEALRGDPDVGHVGADREKDDAVEPFSSDAGELPVDIAKLSGAGPDHRVVAELPRLSVEQRLDDGCLVGALVIRYEQVDERRADDLLDRVARSPPAPRG